MAPVLMSTPHATAGAPDAAIDLTQAKYAQMNAQGSTHEHEPTEVRCGASGGCSERRQKGSTHLGIGLLDALKLQNG